MTMQHKTQQIYPGILSYPISKAFQKESQKHCNVRICVSKHIHVLFQPTSTLQQEFPKRKDKLNAKNTRVIVNQIKCSTCDFAYCGQTSRSLKIRSKEHKRAVQHNHINSKIIHHTLKYHGTVMD